MIVRGRHGLMKVFVASATTALCGIMAATGIELWVRSSWDATNGSPGFFLADAVRGQRLASNYRGWFAGVPVTTNSLGFRDSREYSIEKAPGVFRVVVLGDSVTFGHGTTNETTYPYLLEQRLREWRPETKWEVWNLGVPGYNTSQELAYLLDIGDRYRPDLVVVGFYPNDFSDNTDVAREPSWGRRMRASVLRQLQTRLYSYEFYKRAYLTLRWRLFTDENERRRLEHLATEERLLAWSGDSSARPEQQLSDVVYYDDGAVQAFSCIGVPPPDTRGVDELRAMERNPSSEQRAWLDAVRALQDLDRSGRQQIVFFINMAPEVCVGQDRFYDAGSVGYSDYLATLLGGHTISSVRAFFHYRPSQMPMASGHSIGNSNRVKADVLFTYLRDHVLSPTRESSVLAK